MSPVHPSPLLGGNNKESRPFGKSQPPAPPPPKRSLDGIRKAAVPAASPVTPATMQSRLKPPLRPDIAQTQGPPRQGRQTPRPIPAAKKWQYNARQSGLRSQPQATRSHTRKWSRLSVPLLVLALIASGVVLRFAAASEILIGTYAVVAFMRRIESRITFTLALSSLACVILLLLAWPANALSETFAEYAFLLLIVGTISLVIETHHMGSRLTS